jgi:hypothetical protein
MRNCLSPFPPLFLFLFLFLFLSSARSQERRGIIVDRETGKPVSYATVKVLNTRFGQVASGSGEFSLVISPGDSVLISSVGYRDTILAEKDIKDRIALVPQHRLMPGLTVKKRKGTGRHLIGNGAGLVNKNIKCRYTPGKEGHCVPWGPGAGAEFAELMTLPDSLKTYRLGKVYIPARQQECWQPMFLNIYEPDSVKGGPGTLLFRKPLPAQPENYAKGKMIIDLGSDNVYLSGTKHFFIGINWDTDTTISQDCKTILILLRSQEGISYTRHFRDRNFQWARLYLHRLGDEENKVSYRTMFAAEIEALEDDDR